MATPLQKVVLIILDGWGYAPAWGGNAVENADTPNFDKLWRNYPRTILNASQEAVGLPRHEPGNSEVGHLNIGSGKVIKQNLLGISEEIKNGNFFTNSVLCEAVENAQAKNSNLHLIGLVSDGGVHSHIDHLIALLDFIKQKNFSRVYLHMITDGRDTDPMKALSYLEKLNDAIKKIGIGKISSVMGRYFAMDRDNRWDRVKRAYDVLVLGIGPKAESAEKAIAASYRQGQYDEFIQPTVIEDQKNIFTPIKENDSVILFNYRSDRIREITSALLTKNFRGFDREKYVKNIYFASFAYHEEYENSLPVHVVFREMHIENPIAKMFSDKNLSQFHIAETEKYAHVTYFFDGGKNFKFPNEEFKLIPSPKVATYDIKPEMSAEEVSEHLISEVGKYDFIVCNFANPDMVGHTGNMKATVLACEAVDRCLGKVLERTFAKECVTIVTADHGNAEQMVNPNTGQPHTEHTTNPVPFILCSDNPQYRKKLRTVGGEYGLSLQDISPTILKIMNQEMPKDMTGRSLLE